ncbi:MAG: T9SS type A sorting domain-containing protein [Bacteroidetes bacterium]|nr:T9SS type A sorting domain-containing protein [Bacteroidota bacterium]
MKKIITIFILSIAFYCVRSQTTPAWYKYAGPYNYQNYDVINATTGVDTLGNVYTAASIYDTVAANKNAKVMLVKYNSAGVQQWIKYYVDPSDNNNVSYCAKILVDKSGNSYLCGYARHNTSTDLDFTVIKYDNAGNQVWIGYFDGGQQTRDYLITAQFDNAGNIIIAGNTNFQGTNGYDIAVVKFGISGTMMWSYSYNNAASNQDDNVYDIATDINNNVYLTGNTYVTNARNMLTIKTNSLGINQWTNIVAHTSSGNDEYGYGIVADALGNCYATGALSDWETIKYNAAGGVVWTNHRPVSALNSFSPKHVMLDKFNNVVIAGDAFYSGPAGTDLEVNKINNTNGSILWTMHSNFGGIDSYASMQKDTADNIYVGGFFDGPQGKDISLMTLSPGGNIISSATFANSDLVIGSDRSYQLVLDKNRNIIIVGSSERRGSGSSQPVDVITLKYNALAVGIKTNMLEEGQLSIYPNPCADHLNLSTTVNGLIGADIIITNIIGQVIMNEKLQSLEQSLNLSGMAKGVYFLKIANDRSSISKKLIIE